MPIHKQADGHEGYREDIPLEDAQTLVRNGKSKVIFVEAEPELADRLDDET